MSQNIFGIQVISAFQVFLTVAQYFSNYRLIMRWYQDNPKVNNSRARAIQVGVPASGSTIVDGATGLGEGMAVPEADRDVHVRPIYNDKKIAIPAIPLINEDGEEIVESEDDSKAAVDHFKQSIYDNDLCDKEEGLNVDTASKLMYSSSPVDMKVTKNIRRRSSSKKKNAFG